MGFNRIGKTKLRMSRNYFVDDPRGFTYSIRTMNQYIYRMFYNKISDDSMRVWIPKIKNFRLAIWLKLNDGYIVKEMHDTTDSMRTS